MPPSLIGSPVASSPVPEAALARGLDVAAAARRPRAAVVVWRRRRSSRPPAVVAPPSVVVAARREQQARRLRRRPNSDRFMVAPPASAVAWPTVSPAHDRLARSSTVDLSAWPPLRRHAGGQGYQLSLRLLAACTPCGARRHVPRLTCALGANAAGDVRALVGHWRVHARGEPPAESADAMLEARTMASEINGAGPRTRPAACCWWAACRCAAPRRCSR